MTTARGGYLILDLEHKSLTLGSGHITIPGIYERIEGSYGKPVLISGLVISSIEQDEAYAMARVEGTDYVLRFAGLTLSINVDDEVSIAEQVAGEPHIKAVIAQNRKSATYTNPDSAEYFTIKLHYTVNDGESTFERIVTQTVSVVSQGTGNMYIPANYSGRWNADTGDFWWYGMIRLDVTRNSISITPDGYYAMQYIKSETDDVETGWYPVDTADLGVEIAQII